MTTENSEQKEKKQYLKANFSQIVFLLSTQAWQQLGVLPNPLSQKTEVDLDLAKFTIDLLEILAEKTKGNLTKDEEEYLENSLCDLRLRYVQLTATQTKQTKDKEPESTDKNQNITDN